MKNILLAVLLFLSFRSSAVLHADFSADHFSGCSPLLVNFHNTTLSNNINLQWSFGNGNFSNLSAPSAIFHQAGTYAVKLIVSNGLETDSITQIITVFQTPIVNFQALNVDVCEHDTVQIFSNITLGNAPITDYAWDMGNGIARSGENVKYVYGQPGSYDITLVVQDSNTCNANLTKHLYVTVLPKPHAEFTASPTPSCNSSELITFTNSSTGNNLSFIWTLEDSVTSTLQNPQHVYSQQIENVQLIATSSNGCKDSVSHKVSVTSLITDFVANKTQACTGEIITFSNTSNFVQSCLWFFGDGSYSTLANPNKIYTTPGTYTVTLISKVGSVCKDTLIKAMYITIRQGVIPSFSVTTPNTCSDTIQVNVSNTTPGTGMGYHWIFDHDTLNNIQNPTHTYYHNGNYTITLIITDTSGCTIPVTQNITINNQNPVAKFKGDTLGCPGGTVRFYNQSIGGTSYLWNFGDGTTDTHTNPTHTYMQPGYYTVTLTASNGQGCDSTLVKSNFVHVASPQIDFVVNQTYSPCPPFVALFNSFSDRTGLKYLWNFGDGNTDTASNPTHVFFHPGIYTVQLIAYSATGCNDTVTYPDLINVQGPSGVFTATPGSGCLPLTVSFTATVSPNTLSMWCDLGDGTLVSDSSHISYTYNQEGSFNPKYILIDHVGCAVPYQLPTIVTHTIPTLELPDTTICQTGILEIQLPLGNYTWQPSTYLSCDTCSDVLISAMNDITYEVTIQNEFGCKAADTFQVYVEEHPQLFLNPDTITVCRGTSFQLNAGNADKINWTPASFLSNTNVLYPTCTPDTSITYWVTAESNHGCRNNTKLAIKVLDKLLVSASPDLTICPDDTFQLTANVLTIPDSVIIHYSWSPANLLNVSDISNPIGYNLNTTTTFQVIAGAGTCAADTARVTITNHGYPEMNVGENVTTTPNTEINLTAFSASNLAYHWSAEDSTSCADCKTTIIFPSHSQTIYITGINADGCVVKDSLLITVLNCDPELLFLANTFTPNGDGQNEKFFVRSQNITDLSYFRVFDEWGNMVYESTDMKEGWDGYSQGTPAASAVYTYLVSAKCSNGYEVLKSGNVALMR